MAGGFAALADAIEGDWRSLARVGQLAPAGDWSIWLVCAGRGYGKTRTGAEWVRSLAEAGSVSRIALCGPTAADVRDMMVEGQSGLLAIAPNGNRPTYEPSKRRLVWANGVQAALFSSEEPDRLRGPQFGAAWCDELAAWRNIKDCWDNLQFGLRLGKRPRVVVTTTPRPIKLLRELLKRDDVVTTHGSTYENRANLASSFFSQIVTAYEGTRIGRQELLAELLTDTPGALWSYQLIEENRRARADVPSSFKRVVVAIDPATTVSEQADETGLVVAALGDDGRGYLLEDCSGKMSPIDWAREAIRLYRKYGADRIVAEVNQGGLMIEQTLRTLDPNVSYKGVHASRGKAVRAEPIAELSEQHKILHVGAFVELESQLCSYAVGASSSPDRLDSYVIAFSELMLGPANDGLIEYYRQEVERQNGEAGAERDASDALPISETVALLAPEGCCVIHGMSPGRKYHPDEHGLVHVEKHDVIPLERVGFKKLEEIGP